MTVRENKTGRKTRNVSAMVLALVAGAALATVAVGETPAKPDDKKPAPPAAAAPAAQAPAAKVDPNGPKLFLKTDKIDVGTVPKGETIKGVFAIKNEGKSDLHITDVKPSCGCTVPEYDKVVKPGAEGKVTLNVATQGFQGPISKTALVVSDDPGQPQVTLFLTANVKPYVEAVPYGFFRIQALTGEPASSELILVSDEPDFKPSKAEVTQSFLKVSLAPVAEKERVPNKNPNQYKVTLSSDATAPEGLVGGYVKVTTGAKKQPELDLTISGYIKPTVSVSPTTVNFGNFDPKGDAVTRNILLVNNNTKNDGFSVMKAESSVADIKAEVKPVENDKSRVQVVLTVDQKIKKGVFDGEVVIKTNDATKGEIKIPVKGVVL